MHQTVVAVIGFCELREATTAPVKIAAVDNDATDTGAVPADIFGETVYDNVGTVLEWAADQW